MGRGNLYLLAIGGLGMLVVAGGLGGAGVLIGSPPLVAGAILASAVSLASLLAIILVFLRRLGDLLPERNDVRGIRHDLASVRSSLRPGPGGLRSNLRNELVRDTAALLTLHDMLPTPAEHAPVTAYSALPATVLMVTQAVVELHADALVLELGSGATTLWMALAVQQRGGDVRIVSLEESEEFADVIRRALERNGVSSYVDVRVAEMVPTKTKRGEQPWYDPSGWDDLTDIDLLFVDGPPGVTAPLARYPVVEMLTDRLAPGAVVVVDDTNRPDEQALVEAWCATLVRGEHPREVETRERTVMLRMP
jgi:predicted O-methyltransferase YrrM